MRAMPDVQAMASPPLPVATSSPPSPLLTSADQWWVPRSVAMRVPSVRRCRQVIAGAISTMNLTRWEAEQQVPMVPGSDDVTDAFLRRPQPDRPLSWLLAWTVDDLLFSDIAHWLIRARRPGSATPAAVERIAPEECHADPDGGWWVRGVKVPARDVITFYGTAGPILRDGAGAILTALELEAAATRYARAPAPSVVLKNLGVELTAEEQEELLNAWEQARTARSTAFLNANVDLSTQGWNAAELQLVEGRQHAALEIARLFNLPPKYASAPVTETLTYSNVQDERRDLADLTLRPVMAIISHTLSVDPSADVGYTLCARGRDIRVDPSEFLAMSDLNRAALWAANITSGVLTVEEARALEPLATQR